MNYRDILDKLPPERQQFIKAIVDEMREDQSLFRSLLYSGMNADDAEDVVALASDWRKVGEDFGMLSND